MGLESGTFPSHTETRSNSGLARFCSTRRKWPVHEKLWGRRIREWSVTPVDRPPGARARTTRKRRKPRSHIKPDPPHGKRDYESCPQRKGTRRSAAQEAPRAAGAAPPRKRNARGADSAHAAGNGARPNRGNNGPLRSSSCVHDSARQKRKRRQPRTSSNTLRLNALQARPCARNALEQRQHG